MNFPGQPFARVALTIGISLLPLAPAASADPAPPRYNRDVRPILSDNCFRCHGPELKSRKAKLRLDVREVAVEKEAIVPGKPAESGLIHRLESTDPDEHMPPPSTHKTVTPAQIETLRRWIAAGANYEPHWSYAPLQRPALPTVQDSKWTHTPPDNFILARLEELHLAPSPAAARRALLRRLALDLTGLPPTPDEVERFVKDAAPDAYAKQVERLLASPHYGERMAVPWLDAVRFADTVGYHGDQNQNIFPYRDYVIDAFNRNQPFDQFTIEQLAGDLLPNATVAQRIASGCNRLNMMTREGGAQPAEYLAKYQADRVRTVATAWLGSTMACCECHDHKYDPFSTKDFYSLGAFFADVKQWGVYADYNYTRNPELRGFNNEFPFPPEIQVTNRALQLRESRLKTARDQFTRDTVQHLDAPGRAAFAAWRKGLAESLKNSPDGWHRISQPTARTLETNHTTRVTVAAGGLIQTEFAINPPTNPPAKKAKDDDAEEDDSAKNEKGAPPAKLEVEFAPPAGWLAALRLELNAATTNQDWPQKFPATADVKFTAELRRGTNPPVKLAFSASAATTHRPIYDNGAERLNVHPSWRLPAAAATNSPYAVYVLDTPQRITGGEKIKLTLTLANTTGLRLATTGLAAAEPLASGAVAELQRANSSWTAAAKSAPLATAWLFNTTNQPAALARLKELATAIRACRGGVVPTLVTEALTTNRLVMRVLPRGNWQDQSGEIVTPAVPHFLPQPKHDGTNLLTRLDLAHWLVAPENPLPARAFVNRLWKQFLGTGLSNQPEELGTQGEYPSHPELLDWLAVEFRESGWDVKHLVRLIVSSAVYQQDSKYRPELRDLDPGNRLLARQNARRLDAELVRDNALAVAGLLNDEIGGPSAHPYQPADYYANLQFPDRDYFASSGPEQYRRGLYTHWQRTFLHPMLANFDAPAREECTVDRPQSCTPQQALTLLNDPTFVEAARALAQKVLAAPAPKTDAARVALAIETVLLRPAKPAELDSLVPFLAGQRSYYTANPAEAEKLLRVGQSLSLQKAPPAEAAAWTSVARVLLNLHEAITRY